MRCSRRLNKYPEKESKRAENYTAKVLQYLKETNGITNWRQADWKEDEYFGFDFVASIDDGLCFIDTKNRRLKSDGMATSRRLTSETRWCRDRKKRLILYYRPKLNNPIQDEALFLMDGIISHQEKLREILLSKQVFS